MKSVKELLQEINDVLSEDKNSVKDETYVARVFLDRVNEYFYQSTNSEYISEYHEYWEKNHKDILRIEINEKQAGRVAEVFNRVFANPSAYPDIEISPRINRNGLSVNDIANIRFFTAIQDFKIDIYKGGKDPFQQYLKKPEWFTASRIVRNRDIIIDFLKFLGALGSQVDKRESWMKNAAEFLLQICNGDAFNIYEICNNDVLEVRKLLADNLEIGYSRKKADMLIRDMLDWKVWKPGKNVDSLNVASDANTMRIALRAGILEMPIKLVASYLDIYCYQYAYMDNMTQKAWRCVWEKWKEIYPNNCPASPASMDYLIYKSIGKKNCKPNARKCSVCILDSICPKDKRNLKSPKSISIEGQTGWKKGKTDSGGGGGIMA